MAAQQKLGTGCIPTPPELLSNLAFVSAPGPSVAEGPWPSAVDLSSRLSPIKNQANYNACSAFACCAATEFVPFDRAGQNESERFLWYVTKANDGGQLGPPELNRGTSIAVAIGQLMRTGSCWESACPTTEGPLLPPPPSAYAQAGQMRVTHALKVQPNNSDGVKNILRYGWPVIIGFYITSDTLNQSGFLSMPNGQPNAGGHAVLIVGYDDNTQLFKIKNSYGTGWGQQGYGYMPYAFVREGNTFDLFVIDAQQYIPEGGAGALAISGNELISSNELKAAMARRADFMSRAEITDGLQPGDIDWASEMKKLAATAEAKPATATV